MIPIPKYNSFYFKLLVIILWGEGELSYIRRQKLRYMVHTAALRKRFRKKAIEINKAFDNLADMGYIYNVVKENGSIRFELNLPGYLTLSEDAFKTEAYVPERKI